MVTATSLDRRRLKYFAKYRREFRSEILRQYEPFMQGILKANTTFEIQMNADNFKADERGFTNIYFRLYPDVGVDFASFVYSKFIKQDFTTYWEQFMLRFAQNNAGDRIKLVTNTTKDELTRVTQQAIANGIENGASVYTISKEINRTLKEQSLYRAERIARTEVVSASNEGSLLGAQSTGLRLKKVWLSATDFRTRDEHLHANGQEVDINDKFTVGGEKMSYPGDISASAGNTINCRCSMWYKEKTPIEVGVSQLAIE